MGFSARQITCNRRLTGLNIERQGEGGTLASNGINISLMQNNEVKIGKFILDSLAIGMYNDPLMVIREYIQNSVDSIDNRCNFIAICCSPTFK